MHWRFFISAAHSKRREIWSCDCGFTEIILLQYVHSIPLALSPSPTVSVRLSLFQSISILACMWAFLRVCSGFASQTNNKGCVLSVLLYIFMYRFFLFLLHFSTHSLCISVFMKQNSVTTRKNCKRKRNEKKRRNDESNRSHGQMEYCVDICVCVYADRDCWSWWIALCVCVFFVLVAALFSFCAHKWQRFSQKTDIKDNRVSMRVCECFSNNLNLFIYEKIEEFQSLWFRYGGCSRFAVSWALYIVDSVQSKNE